MTTGQTPTTSSNTDLERTLGELTVVDERKQFDATKGRLLNVCGRDLMNFIFKTRICELGLRASELRAAAGAADALRSYDGQVRSSITEALIAAGVAAAGPEQGR